MGGTRFLDGNQWGDGTLDVARASRERVLVRVELVPAA